MIETPGEALARLREEWSRAASSTEREALAEVGKAVKAVADVFGAGEPDRRKQP